MNYREWMETRLGDIRVNKTNGLKRTVYDVWEKTFRTAYRTIDSDYGTSVYEREWDLLVVLDACPYRLMREVEDEFDFLSGLESFESVGTATGYWMRKTFTDPKYRDKIKKTTYINSNPNSKKVLDSSYFHTLDDVWKYGYEEELYVTPPRVVTDRVIESFREGRQTDRVIAHYMPPHAPFLPHMDLTEHTDDEYEISIWRAVMRGWVDAETVWDAYRDNLRYVLGELAILFENVDADAVAITSDHGNALGEKMIYGHGGPPIDALIEVPWVPVGSTTDSGSHEPESYQDTDVNTSVKRQLRDLGYAD